ncbi:ypfD [Symbiodinium sp. KB8]|nr:ypfD [Symbiodinium sp. KB8]
MPEASERGMPPVLAVAATALLTGALAKRRMADARAAAVALRAKVTLNEPLFSEEAWSDDVPSELRVQDLDVGQELTGIVVRVVEELGCFVDVGADRQGLVHRSKISKSYVPVLSEAVQTGQTVKVWVRAVSPQGRLDLTMVDENAEDESLRPFKEVSADEWFEAEITGLSNAGAFVRVQPPGGGELVDGFIPISQIQEGFVEHPADVLEFLAQRWRQHAGEAVAPLREHFQTAMAMSTAKADASPSHSEVSTASPRSVASEYSGGDSDMDLGVQSPVAGIEAKLPDKGKGLLNSLWEECNLLVYRLKDNLNAGATPVVVMYLATATATTGATCSGAIAAAMMGLLYLTVFDLVNQWSGVEEDMVNKPWRPIPQGLMTVWGCKMRCGAVAIVCLAASCLYDLVIPCALCFSATFGYAVGWDKNFIFRGFVFMPMIFMIHFFVSMRLALGPAADNKALWDWAGNFAAYYSILFLLADLRDLKGDAQVGRRTLPVLLGAHQFRAMLFVLVTVLSPPGFYRMLEALWAQQEIPALACSFWNFLFVITILYMLATGESVKVGQTVQARVTDATSRLKLSMRKVFARLRLEDQDVSSLLDVSPDTWFTGTVDHAAPFGVFVKIPFPDNSGEGMGLVHISEIRDGRVGDPAAEVDAATSVLQMLPDCGIPMLR